LMTLPSILPAHPLILKILIQTERHKSKQTLIINRLSLKKGYPFFEQPKLKMFLNIKNKTTMKIL
jgi:hypothetical protein